MHAGSTLPVLMVMIHWLAALACCCIGQGRSVMPWCVHGDTVVVIPQQSALLGHMWR